MLAQGVHTNISMAIVGQAGHISLWPGPGLAMRHTLAAHDFTDLYSKAVAQWRQRIKHEDGTSYLLDMRYPATGHTTDGLLGQCVDGTAQLACALRMSACR